MKGNGVQGLYEATRKMVCPMVEQNAGGLKFEIIVVILLHVNVSTYTPQVGRRALFISDISNCGQQVGCFAR
jgi:hypothetical protein